MNVRDGRTWREYKVKLYRDSNLDDTRQSVHPDPVVSSFKCSRPIKGAHFYNESDTKFDGRSTRASHQRWRELTQPAALQLYQAALSIIYKPIMKWQVETIKTKYCTYL